jgi:site-specific recombinase XerD
MRLKNEMDRATRHFIEMMQRLGWSEHTLRAYERGVMFFTRWLIKETSIESLREITSETIEAWRQELCGWRISQATCDLRFAAVKTFIRMMNETGAIDADVAARVALPRRRGCDRVDTRPVLTRDEAKQAIDRIEPISPLALRDRAILEVLLVTGIRNSELRALTLSDVDFEDGTLLVRCGKGKKVRIVPLGAAAAALGKYVEHARPRLASEASGDMLFLSREHGVLSREALVRIVRLHTGVAPHRLRHACATLMLRGGAREEKIQAVLGHASSETTKIYMH